MVVQKIQLRPVDSYENLRSRVVRLFSSKVRRAIGFSQLDLELPSLDEPIETNFQTLGGFIDFLAASVPRGEVYLFGGVLRDLALLGREGFKSDVDIVVEGDWKEFVRWLDVFGARRNRFGGYRVRIGNWPIDVWNAEETWAIRRGLVPYMGIMSLTKTTVLNWDAILMNWRTRRFICNESYLDDLRGRILDIVLEDNPNPLGMAVRVFRHISTKEARRIGRSAISYLERCTTTYSLDELKASELQSYGNSMIEGAIFHLFQLSAANRQMPVNERFYAATEAMSARGDSISLKQWDLSL